VTDPDACDWFARKRSRRGRARRAGSIFLLTIGEVQSTHLSSSSVHAFCGFGGDFEWMCIGDHGRQPLFFWRRSKAPPHDIVEVTV
jgi:hypothetical protein